MTEASADYPVTPDGRYFVVRGRLWRRSNPALSAHQRDALVAQLMEARRSVGRALRSGDAAAVSAARKCVNDAKVKLGERGPVWWNDDSPDYNRHLVKNSPYLVWYRALGDMPDGPDGQGL